MFRARGSDSCVTVAFWQLGSAIVPVVGLVFQATNSLYFAFVTLAVGPFLGAVCMAFMREPGSAANCWLMQD